MTAGSPQSATQRHLLRGIVVMVLSAFVIAAPVLVGDWALALVGLLIAAIGVLELADVFYAPERRVRASAYLGGLLAVLAGLLLFLRPTMVLSGLIVLLAAIMAMDGVQRILSPSDVDNGQDFSFLVIGDPGEGDASQFALKTSYLRAGSNPNVRFVVISSDVIYPDGAMKDYEPNFYLPLQGLTQPIYAIPGNHDWFNALDSFTANFFKPDGARAAIQTRVATLARVADWRQCHSARRLSREPRGIRDPHPIEPQSSTASGPASHAPAIGSLKGICLYGFHTLLENIALLSFK